MTMAGTESAPSQRRPRAASWGEPASRLMLHRLAQRAALRSGFKVSVIEVLRVDRTAEFVAIAGDPATEEHLLGQSTPSHVERETLRLARVPGEFTFVAEEDLPPLLREGLETYGHVPELEPSEDPGAWRPFDMMVARLEDRQGVHRAVMYLDEPLDGRRPSRERVADINTELSIIFESVVVAVEREEFAEEVRLSRAAREIVRAATSQLGLDQLLTESRQNMLAGFHASDLWIHVFPDVANGASPDELIAPVPDGAPTSVARLEGALLEETVHAARRAWEAQRVVIAEPERVWGDADLDAQYRSTFGAHLADHDLGALIVFPLGAGPEPVGMLVLARAHDGLRWTDGESSAALGLGRDLGAAILNSRAFEREHRLVNELRRLDTYRSELISTVSHELRNPIGVILGHLEMLSAVPELPDRAHRSLRSMERGAERLVRVAEDLLLLARLGNPDTPLVAGSVGLGPLAHDVVDLATVLASTADVGLVVDAPEADVAVRGDANELHRVLTNLVSNAVKYSHHGGEVRVAVRRAGGEAVVTVSDDGLGISAADQERLFTEFFRSTNAEALARPGTGLGLAIVQRIVRRHSGRIDVDSTLGAGTTFTLTLPLAAS